MHYLRGRLPPGRPVQREPAVPVLRLRGFSVRIEQRTHDLHGRLHPSRKVQRELAVPVLRLRGIRACSHQRLHYAGRTEFPAAPREAASVTPPRRTAGGVIFFTSYGGLLL